MWEPSDFELTTSRNRWGGWGGFVEPVRVTDSMPPRRRGRRKREYIAGIYIPKERRAYGPRAGWRPAEYAKFPAATFKGRESAVSFPMPRGGVRWMVRCPHCHELRRVLYRNFTPGDSLHCRVCLGGRFGVRYDSQYGYQRRVTMSEEEQWQRHQEHKERRWSLYLKATDRATLLGEIAVARMYMMTVEAVLASVLTRLADEGKEPDEKEAADITDLNAYRDTCMEALKEARAALKQAA